MTGDVKVKICGITRVEDAEAAARSGADLIGLNFWHGTPRRVRPEAAREIIAAVQGKVDIVAVFVNAPLDEILETTQALGIGTVQLHGRETAGFARSLPGLNVIKAFHPRSEADLAAMDGFPADIYLLDASGGPMPGGTGRTIDWSLAKKAESFGRILLAGGLTPENVAEAVQVAEPWGVDTASGVETSPGIKDAAKIERFIRNAKRGETR